MKLLCAGSYSNTCLERARRKRKQQAVRGCGGGVQACITSCRYAGVSYAVVGQRHLTEVHCERAK